MRNTAYIFHAQNKFSVRTVRTIPVGWKALSTPKLVITHSVEKKSKIASDRTEELSGLGHEIIF